MNNKVQILFHNIEWFLENSEIDILNDSWKESIKSFINQEYIEGQFQVEYPQDKVDNLIWKIKR